MNVEAASDDGKTKSKAPNPEFGTWYARDQQVFFLSVDYATS